MSNKALEKSISQAESLAVDPVFNIWALLHQTVDAITRAREKELKHYGIAVRQVSALFAINHLGGQATPTELARWLFRKPHTISSILNRMAREGLIEKSRDTERKNVVRVILTEKGRRAYQYSTRRESVHRIMSGLNETELERLRSYLEKLREKAFAELKVTNRPPFPPVRITPSGRPKPAPKSKKF